MDYDIAVIGAGIQGAGVAQAAAAAGHKVLVLEERDIAAGTSSKSSKLIHGGLRYLESLQFGLVRESLEERAILLKIAPDLVRLRALHIPIYRNSRRSPLTIAAGLSLYRLLSGFDHNTRFERVARSDWKQLDSLSTTHLRQVFRYFEAQTDDAALTRAVLNSALSFATELQLPARFTGAEITPDGCELRYCKNEQEYQATCRVLVNCAGPWAAEVNALITPTPALPSVELVQGAHLLLPPLLKEAYYLESPKDGRAVFALPWQECLLLGTTETAHTGDPATAACHPHEMHYLLDVLKHYFPHLHPLPSQAETFAGLRVLPHTAENPFGRSREVIFNRDNPALPRVLTVMGGKLTTYRATAAQALAHIKPALPERKPLADTRALKLTV